MEPIPFLIPNAGKTSTPESPILQGAFAGSLADFLIAHADATRRAHKENDKTGDVVSDPTIQAYSLHFVTAATHPVAMTKVGVLPDVTVHARDVRSLCQGDETDLGPVPEEVLAEPVATVTVSLPTPGAKDVPKEATESRAAEPPAARVFPDTQNTRAIGNTVTVPLETGLSSFSGAATDVEIPVARSVVLSDQRATDGLLSGEFVAEAFRHELLPTFSSADPKVPRAAPNPAIHMSAQVDLHTPMPRIDKDGELPAEPSAETAANAKALVTGFESRLAQGREMPVRVAVSNTQLPFVQAVHQPVLQHLEPEMRSTAEPASNQALVGTTATSVTTALGGSEQSKRSEKETLIPAEDQGVESVPARKIAAEATVAASATNSGLPAIARAETVVDNMLAEGVEDTPASTVPEPFMPNRMVERTTTGLVALPAGLGHRLAEFATQFPDRPIEVTLSPEELGRVRMSLVTHEGALTMMLQAERPETLDLLRRNIDQLAQDFRDLGFQDLTFRFGSGDHPSHQQVIGGKPDEIGESGDASLPSVIPAQPEPMAQRLTDVGLDIRL